jgi:hypothetical protein
MLAISKKSAGGAAVVLPSEPGTAGAEEVVGGGILAAGAYPGLNMSRLPVGIGKFWGWRAGTGLP